jgi:hypothetical protein
MLKLFRPNFCDKKIITSVPGHTAYIQLVP